MTKEHDWAVVEWSKAVTIDDLEEIDDERDADLYALIAADEDEVEGKWTRLRLLYIGSAFLQFVATRIRQPHNAYACVNRYMHLHPGKVLLVMTGTITEASLERISETFVREVECCLINCNQPHCNDVCMESYSGRELVVRNSGDYAPLRSRCHCVP